MTGRLEGKIAFVTGAASGLGEAIARRYAAEGASVILADLDTAAGQAVARDIGPNARFVTLDVTREDQWLAAFATCERIESRIEADWARRSRRCASVVPSPNRRSNTSCGSFSIGSGSDSFL